MARVLVVANQSLLADELHAVLQRRAEQGPCTFHVVVPATPLTDQQLAMTHSEHLGSAAGESGPVRLARWRLRHMLEALESMGIEAQGYVGHADPVRAVGEAMEKGPVDEVIISTLARRRSRWIARDIPKRIHRRFGVRVEHVETGMVFPPFPSTDLA